MDATKDAKLAVALLVILLASALLWLQRLNGDQWVSAVTWTVAAYMLGQAAGIFANGYAASSAAKVSAATGAKAHDA